jgi:probable O-glycosylation ligase (exosortase A-associated)
MRDIFVTAVIFGLLPFVFKRPWVGILLWSWLGYMSPHRLTWGFAYNLPFSMIVGLVTIVAFVASKEKKDMPWTRETIVLLIFIGWMLFTTFFAFYPDLAWFQWNKVWKIQLMVFLTALIITDRQKLHWLVWVIVLSFGFYGVKGGIFTIINGGAYRVQGPAETFIQGNNEMALALVMTIPLIRYLHLQETRKWIKTGLASAMVLTGVAAIGSQSRGGLVAMVAMGEKPQQIRYRYLYGDCRGHHGVGDAPGMVRPHEHDQDLSARSVCGRPDQRLACRIQRSEGSHHGRWL